jgi:hypothetical protein
MAALFTDEMNRVPASLHSGASDFSLRAIIGLAAPLK